MRKKKMTTTKVPIKTYTELCNIKDYKDRFEYLMIGGDVGKRTFGSDRVFNQQFYKSGMWLKVRDFVIARDLGRDLGHIDHEIPEGVSIIIHHMNPITVDDVTLNCLRAMRELNGILYSAAVRRAVWSYYQDKCFIMPDSSPAPGAGAVAPDSRKDAPALEG